MVCRHFKYKLIVNLQDHLCVELFLAKPTPDRDHGQFDHIGGGALDHAVDGRAFGQVQRAVTRVVGSECKLVARTDPLNGTSPAEHGGNVPIAAAIFERAEHKLRNAAIRGKVAVDEFGGFLLSDSQSFRKTKRALSVNDAEVDGL